MPKPETSKFFLYALKDIVVIQASGESGMVIARSDSIDGGDQYLLRYRDATGHAKEAWWSESALQLS